MAAMSSYIDHALPNYKECHPVVESVNSENRALYKLVIYSSPGHWGSECPAQPPWRAK